MLEAALAQPPSLFYSRQSILKVTRMTPRTSTALAVVALLTLGAAPLAAGPLSDYNLILFQNYNYQGGEVEGRTIVGGDLNAAGQAPTFATAWPVSPIMATVQIVGNTTAANVNMQSGNFVHKGTLSVGNINHNGGGATLLDSGLSVAALQTGSQMDAQAWALIPGNGAFLGAPFNYTLEYTGSSGLAVFTLPATTLFASNNTLQLNVPAGKTVLINVTGTNVVVGGGVNLAGIGWSTVGFGKILWNFPQATSIDFGGIAMKGAVLAPYADTSGGAVFDGAFCAKSYTGAREFHLPPFTGTIEPPPLPVESATWSRIKTQRAP